MSNIGNINIENSSSPKARAKRLRRLRNMVNLSREELCNVNPLNVNTYNGWENGRFGGLSEKGAKEIIKRIAKEGAICSLNWLLNGEGSGPFLTATVAFKESDNDTAAILRELTVFQNNFSYGMFVEITDDGVLPQYNIGDYAAGVKTQGKDIRLLVGKICIVQTVDYGILVRQLRAGTSNKTYTLVCTNPETTLPQSVLFDIEINSAALITRHYIKGGQERKIN